MRPRAWRIMMWMSLAATVVLVGAAVGTRGQFQTWTDGSGRVIGLADGRVVVYRWRLPPGLRGEPALTPPEGWLHYVGGAYGWTFEMSLWLPAGATFAITGPCAFMVYRARRRPGHCPKCGYDLSGLSTNATCPECGTGLHAAHSGHRP